MMRMKKALCAFLLFAAIDAGAAISLRLQSSDSPGGRGDGGALEGFPTHKWVVESAFDLTIEPGDPKGIMHAEMTSESRRTERIPAGPVAVVMEQMSRTGIMTLDKLFGPAPGTGVKGFPLKVVTTLRGGRRGGKVITKTITVEAKDIRTDAAAPAPEQFAIPADYTKFKD